MSAAVSGYHAIANGRDTTDSGHGGSHFGRPLDARNAPIPEIADVSFDRRISYGAIEVAYGVAGVASIAVGDGVIGIEPDRFGPTRLLTNER